MPASVPSLSARCFAECLGTFMLVFFGCGAVHAAVLTNAQSGLWQVAIVWGLAVALAIYVVGGVSGAHLNPAITVALAVWGKFQKRDVGPYIVSQCLGAFVAAAALFYLYEPFLARYELEHKVVRGEAGSEATAQCYGEFFPPPTTRHPPLVVGQRIAFPAEVLGTLLLALVVFAVTDERNSAAPAARLAPAFIGLTVAALISVIAPLTQACFNPARDFGPRIFAYLAGWGPHAFSPGLSFFTVYILAPTLGAIAGGGIYLKLIRPALPSDSEIPINPWKEA